MAVKNKIYLTVSIFAVIILLITVFLIFPALGKIKDNSKELSLQKNHLVNLEDKINNLEHFRELYDDLEYFLKEIDTLFVDAKVPIEFINFLEKTSEKCNLKTEIMPVEDKELEKTFWPYLSFRIVSIGSFPDFMMFLEKMENNPYLIEIHNMNINLIAEEDSLVNNIRADFLVRVFVR